jgi:hypothetical protein
MGRLEAEEALASLETMAAATGHMSDKAVKDLQQSLERRVGVNWRKPVRPASVQEFRTMVAELGESGFKIDIKE